MKTIGSIVGFITFFLFLNAFPALSLTFHNATEPIDTTKAQIVKSYGKLPFSFEKNQGQTNDKVRFLSRGRGYALFLTENEAVLALRSSSKDKDLVSKKRNTLQAPGNVKQKKNKGSVIRMKFFGANATPVISGEEKLPGKSNYFKGIDSSKWRTNISKYARVRYKEVYPGIDVVFYGNQRRLEYDLVVSPGSDPSKIRLEIQGAKKLSIDKNGNLVLRLKYGDVIQRAPVIYQEIDGKKMDVAGGYLIDHKGRVGFTVASWNRQKPLVIDPVLVYSTYLGGSDSEQGYGIAVDSSGNAYVTGRTSSSDFPSVNAPYPDLRGSSDVFIFKLSADGSNAVYSTYLGGSSYEYGYGIAVDSSGNAYVTGNTGSSNFPTVNALYPELLGSSDAFIFKLSADGSHAVYSTYLGGSTSDWGEGIAVDGSGNAYVTGRTSSSDFPSVNAPYPDLRGSSDVFIFKLSADGSNAVYSTYLGGSDSEWGYGIAVDSSGNAYVTGNTGSSNFPTVNALYPELLGSSDAFIFKLSADGSHAVYSTYLGGSSYEYGNGIAVDGSGNAYVTGYTRSSDFPRVNALYPDLKGRQDAFIFKLSADGSNAVYSTYLGGSDSDYCSGESGNGITVDTLGNAYVTGVTCSQHFPTINALYSEFSGYTDAYVFKLSANGSHAIYSTYLGGKGNEHGHSIAVDNSGNAYVTGNTSSSNFPLVNALYPDLWGDNDAFIVKLSDNPADEPTIAQSPMFGPPGTTFTQWGTGFTPNSTVTLHFRNHLGEELPSLQVDTSGLGAFEYVYNSPLDKPEGTHTWWAEDDVSGSQSEILGYLITGEDGVNTQITEGQIPEDLPLPKITTPFGELVPIGEWNELKDIFVIVHGWNRENLDDVPSWVTDLCDDIKDATGENVFYWNWQDKAKSNGFVGEVLTDDKCIDFPYVPFDMTRESGEWLTYALQRIVPTSYEGNIHLIGHSLGTLVITYAAQYAHDYNWQIKDKINHLVFLDSPCHIGSPGDKFLKSMKDNIFLENYWSAVGKFTGYDEADTNIYLPKSSTLSGLVTVKNPHAYSHVWYRSSVTNFDRPDLLGDPSAPETDPHYGFYWHDKDKRNDVSPFYAQYRYSYHWQLYSGYLVYIPGAIFDSVQYSGEMSAQTLLKLNEFAERSEKKVTLMAVNTFNTVSDTANYVTDQLGHAVHEAFSCESGVCGALRLEHHSTSVVTTLVEVPADANALTFGYKFYYALPGTVLEVFLENLSIYHSFSHQDIYEGYRLAPFIDVSQYAGNEVKLSFRISNPVPEAEGAVMIDDLIFAKIQNQYPGDCNDDSDEDGSDLAIFISDFISNNPLGLCNADYNNDGNVDSTDLRIFARSFGMKD